MFSFFNNMSISSHKLPKPVVSLYGACKSYIVYNTMHYLSNGLILSVGRYDPDDKNSKDKIGHTEFLLFDPKKNMKTAEVILSKEYHVISNLFDNKLLLRPSNYNDQSDIAIFDCLELKIIDYIDRKIDQDSHWTSIGNEKFILIETPSFERKDAPFRLLIQDLKNKKFNQPASSPLPIDEKEAVALGTRYYISIHQFSVLSNGQYACMVLGHNTNYFKIFLYDRIEESQFKLAGIIDPLYERRCGDDSTPRGNYMSFSNGNILTYNTYGRNFQVWQNMNCIDTWSWDQIKCDNEEFKKGFWTQQVLPLADNEHLLIKSHTQIYLFNIKNRHMQTVDIGNYDPYDIVIGDNNRIIVRAQEKGKPFQVNNTILWVDLNKMLPHAIEYKATNLYKS